LPLEWVTFIDLQKKILELLQKTEFYQQAVAETKRRKAQGIRLKALTPETSVFG
jgi:hypothetical protein